MDVDALRRARRILVIGCSGGGKSTLARQLADMLDLTYVSMDREFFWLPGWIPRDRDEAISLMRQAVAQERWVIDGTSPGTLPIRLARADFIIWLRMPRLLCVCRVLGRRIRYAGRSRPEMADGCPERVSPDFLRYIWNFEKTETPEISEALDTRDPATPLLVLRRPAEVNDLVARLASAV